MKSKSLMIVALCLASTVAKAQVVYGDDEKDYARTTASSMPVSSTKGNLQQQSSISDGISRFRLSGIGDNWFASVQAGTSTFLGAPKGCGDFYDKTKYTMVFSLGKWHSRFFGTRVVYQGFKFANCDKQSVGYQNYHGDLMLNVSSFYRTSYDPLPKWNIIPYVGAGIIRNSELHKKPFAVSYGLIGSYRMSKRVSLSAEVGGTSTFQAFDGKGKDKHFGDNLLQASIGLTVGIGKLGWDKKASKQVGTLPVQDVTDLTPFPRNDYEGLRRLRERMGNGDTTVDERLAKFDAPILFFFKINSIELIDKQQLVNIKEIAGAVNEFDLNLRIVGAADSKTGTPKGNRKLSVRRAKYIAKLLMKAGVPKEKMIGISQGGINIYKPYTANRHTCVIVYKKD